MSCKLDILNDLKSEIIRLTWEWNLWENQSILSYYNILRDIVLKAIHLKRKTGTNIGLSSMDFSLP